MPGHNKLKVADVRQLNCTVPGSFEAHLVIAQSGGRSKLTWAIADLPRASTVMFFLQQFCILLISKLSMLLKRKASPNFPYLSVVGKATPGQSAGLECLDPPKLTPFIRPWLAWWGEGGQGRAQQLSDSDYLPPQSSETKGRSRGEARFQELIQNNQQKNLISYIYSPSIYISLITDEVRHICVYLLAIWLFSPVIMDVRTVPNFLLKISRKCLSWLGALYPKSKPLFGYMC